MIPVQDEVEVKLGAVFSIRPELQWGVITHNEIAGRTFTSFGATLLRVRIHVFSGRRVRKKYLDMVSRTQAREICQLRASNGNSAHSGRNVRHSYNAHFASSQLMHDALTRETGLHSHHRTFTS